LIAGERAEREIRKAAEHAAEAERQLGRLEDEMVVAGISPDLDRREAMSEAARRLRLLSESLSHER
jgi:hypothetical protein